MKSLKLTLIAIASMHSACWAASISIAIDSGGKSMKNDLGATLSGGLPGVGGDGTQVQLGYFAGPLAPTPFGTEGVDAISSFIPLTGPGTPFGINFTVGDAVSEGAGNGELFIPAFSISTGIADGLLPAAGIPLVLRFFNAAQTFVLDLSNSNGFWNWQTPALVPPSITLNFDDSGLVARGVGANTRTAVAAGSAPQTLNSTVPEPTSGALMVVGLLSLAARRRRRAI